MQKELEVTKSLEFTELKNLANAAGPCITIFTPIEHSPNTSQMEFRRLKSAINRVENELRARDLPESTIREMVGPLHEHAGHTVEWRGEGGTLVILRSPEVFRVFDIHEEIGESAVIANSFHIFPLIHALQVASQQFYLLALSQNNVRLLRCTRTSSEEVDLGPNVPRSLEEWLNTRLPNSAPDHGTVRASDAGTGGSFTSTHDRDNKDEHIANFFRVINKAVFDKLRNEKFPMVLCGVESQRAIYAGINSYPHMMEEGVQGSPESLKGGEMHARALDLAQKFFAGPAHKALELWEDIAGGERALTSFPEIVKAAFEARIAHLFAAEDARTMGVFDREKMEMAVQGTQEDLVNAAALQTIAFGGDVFIMKREDVPAGGFMAAITRF